MRWHRLPTVLFYAPVVPYVIYLCIRYFKSPAIIMAANPIFKHGGLPFTEKTDMQKHFGRVLPYHLLKVSESRSAREKQAQAFVNKHGLPVILKPNTGHRGVGIRKCDSVEQIFAAFEGQRWDWIIQQFDASPCEYGVFFIREPNSESGELVSITKKEIPAHLDLVAASHCQGAEFSNRKDLISPVLKDVVNTLCCDKPFYFGRFDVKAVSDDALRRGEFTIIEVNGATSEFIHVLDDKVSFFEGMSELYRQWRLLYRIAIQSSKKHGIKPKFSDFISLYLNFFKATKKSEGVIW